MDQAIAWNLGISLLTRESHPRSSQVAFFPILDPFQVHPSKFFPIFDSLYLRFQQINKCHVPKQNKFNARLFFKLIVDGNLTDHVIGRKVLVLVQ